MRKWWLFSLVVAHVFLITGCAAWSAQSGPSGLKGEVHIGPACQVVRPGESCPGRPFQAEIAIRDAKGRQVTTVHSDAQGRFVVALKPGDYTLVPKNYGIQRSPQASVTVAPVGLTLVIIHYDSGIR